MSDTKVIGNVVEMKRFGLTLYNMVMSDLYNMNCVNVNTGELSIVRKISNHFYGIISRVKYIVQASKNMVDLNNNIIVARGSVHYPIQDGVSMSVKDDKYVCFNIHNNVMDVEVIVNGEGGYSAEGKLTYAVPEVAKISFSGALQLCDENNFSFEKI